MWPFDTPASHAVATEDPPVNTQCFVFGFLSKTSQVLGLQRAGSWLMHIAGPLSPWPLITWVMSPNLSQGLAVGPTLSPGTTAIIMGRL